MQYAHDAAGTPTPAAADATGAERPGLTNVWCWAALGSGNWGSTCVSSVCQLAFLATGVLKGAQGGQSLGSQTRLC